MTPLALAACLLLASHHGAVGVSNVSLVISPGAVERGETATLHCLYDLEGAPLYAVKWYRGNREFYRFSPNEHPSTKIFPYYGIHVDVSMSNASQVVLRQVGFNLSGNLTCEVTTEAPSFSTASASKHMMVVELPDHGPTIASDKARYEPGDVLKANCSSAPSRPPAALSYLLNNNPVGSPSSRMLLTDHALQWSFLPLELELEQYHFINGQLILKCTAIVSTLYRETFELNLGSARKTSEPVPERVTSWSRGEWKPPCPELVLLTAFLLLS